MYELAGVQALFYNHIILCYCVIILLSHVRALVTIFWFLSTGCYWTYR